MSRLGTALRVLARGERAVQGPALPDASGLLSFSVANRGAVPKRGTAELLKAYSSLPWLRALVHRISNSTASTEWLLYKPGRDQQRRIVGLSQAKPQERRKVIAAAVKQGTLNPVESHPFFDLLDTGNPLLTGMAVRQATQAHLDIVGEAFGLLETNGLGRPVEWWPLPPDWVRETPQPGGEPVFVVRSTSSAKQVKIPAAQMLWFKDVDPADPYGRGTGTGRALGDELDTDEYASKMVKTWFYNRGRPDLLITAEGLTEPETRRMEEGWLERLQGYWNAKKPYFLNRKVDVKDLSQKFTDMQLVELRKFQRDLIIEVFGVSPEILGIVNESKRATIDAADYLYSRWVVTPRLELLRTTLQEALIPMYRGENLIVDYVSPVQEDKEHILNVMRAAPWAFLVDEIREAGGEEELEGGAGRVFVGPLNLIASDTPGGGGAALVPPAASQEESAPDTVDRLPVPSSKIDEADIDRVAAAVDQVNAVAATAPIIEETVLAIGTAQLGELGADIAFDLENPEVVHFLRHQSASRIRGVQTTTKRAVRKALVSGAREGEGVRDLSKRVKAVFEHASKRRALSIARTEIVCASTHGSDAAMKQARVEMKEWLSTRDSRVRDSHQPGIGLDGQRVPVGRNFTSPLTGATGPGPGDMGSAAESIQCRCTLTAVIGERSVADTEEKRDLFWKAREAQRRPFELGMIRALRTVFGGQERAVLRALGGA